MTVTFTNLNESNYQWFSPIIREDMLREYLKRPVLHAIGAVSRTTACGILIYEYDGASFQIRYLAVSDRYRRKGVATGLVATLCRGAWNKRAPVYTEFFADIKREEDDVYMFFERLPFFSLETRAGTVFRADRRAVEESELMKYVGKRTVQGLPVTELSSGKRARLLAAVGADEQMTGCGSGEEIPALCLYTGTVDKPETAIFCTGNGGDTVRVDYAWCSKGKEVTLISLLAEVCDRLLKRKPPVGFLEIAAVTEESEHLTERLIGGAKAVSVYHEVVWSMEGIPAVPEKGRRERLLTKE